MILWDKHSESSKLSECCFYVKANITAYAEKKDNKFFFKVAQ